VSRHVRAADTAQLSLFDAVSAATDTTAVTLGPGRAVSVAPANVDPTSGKAGPSILRHPRARRELWLGEHLVAYEFRHARRRSIGFAIGTDGLSVAAPRWVTQRDVDTALRERSGWILRKLTEQDQHAQRMRLARVNWRDGATIPFLGETVVAVLDARATGTILCTNTTAPPGIPRTLHIGLPHTASSEQIRDAVQAWLQRQALRIFEERCRHFAERLSVQVRRLSLSSAQTRWGSANANGSVRLNWRLIHFGMPTIDYVVAHELAHLRHMDHSPKFWDVVRSVVPDYERARAVLNEDVLPVLD